jgi:hypothetical protein
MMGLSHHCWSFWDLCKFLPFLASSNFRTEDPQESTEVVGFGFGVKEVG